MSDQRHKWKRVPKRDRNYEREYERIRQSECYRREIRRIRDGEFFEKISSQGVVKPG